MDKKNNQIVFDDKIKQRILDKFKDDYKKRTSQFLHSRRGTITLATISVLLIPAIVLGIEKIISIVNLDKVNRPHVFLEVLLCAAVLVSLFLLIASIVKIIDNIACKKLSNKNIDELKIVELPFDKNERLQVIMYFDKNDKCFSSHLTNNAVHTMNSLNRTGTREGNAILNKIVTKAVIVDLNLPVSYDENHVKTYTFDVKEATIQPSAMNSTDYIIHTINSTVCSTEFTDGMKNAVKEVVTSSKNYRVEAPSGLLKLFVSCNVKLNSEFQQQE